ncbi:hypothetical protein E2C01_082680 [Portunus trituberculatus]|uniref:Uncharacterized protein n=1 Tax=Portunus trituberculatus TaxID=210409 RepID=A0A5B7J5S8_PORTR|nr:hypothetical protein [Portunus trituberculatus]
MPANQYIYTERNMRAKSSSKNNVNADRPPHPPSRHLADQQHQRATSRRPRTAASTTSDTCK